MSTRPQPFAWPAGVRCAVFVSVHFDAEAFDLKSTTEDRLFGRFSYGRYGVRAGLPRLLSLFSRRGTVESTAATRRICSYNTTIALLRPTRSSKCARSSSNSRRLCTSDSSYRKRIFPRASRGSSLTSMSTQQRPAGPSMVVATFDREASGWAAMARTASRCSSAIGKTSPHGLPDTSASPIPNIDRHV